MRIISGKFKGRRVKAPKKLPVRPTTDRAKEALFNIFNNRFCFEDINVLDVFAGTGGISFEFASRGVRQLTAVDQNAGCVAHITATAKELGVEMMTVKGNALTFLRHTQATYDLIFADPPYAMAVEEIAKLHETIFINKLLAPDGVFVLEHASHTKIDHFSHFLEKRNYGGCEFSFFGVG